MRDYGLGLELDYDEDGWVSAVELEKGLRCLIGYCEKGKKVRKRTKEMAEASKKAVEGGGSSFSALELLTKMLMLL